MAEDHPAYPTSTPLMKALYLEDDQEAYTRVKELLESGEDPNKFDSMVDSNPLLEAWNSNRIEIMQLLIDAGAKGETVAELPFDFAWIFMDRTIESTQVLIESGYSLDSQYHQNQLDEPVCNGDNLLSFLLEKTRFDFIESLIPHGVLKFIHIYNCTGDAPLGEMARDGHLEQAKWLIRNGADVNAHSEGLIGSTALDRAIESTDIEMTRFLLAAGANPNIPTWMWITATDRAVNFMPDFEFRRKESRVIPDAVQIREMILKACTKFPRPIMHDGSTPKVWPPTPKSK